MGHEVDMYTTKVKADVMRQVCANAGICLTPKLINLINDSASKIFSILAEKHLLSSIWLINNYKRNLRLWTSKINRLSTDYDLIITKQSPMISYGIDLLPGDVMYFHFPTTLAGLMYIDKYIPDDNMPLVKLYKKFVVSMEFTILYESLCIVSNVTKKIIVGNTWTKENLIKLNSSFLSVAPEPCKRKLGKMLTYASVTYEPIEYETYATRYNPRQKKNLVLTVSRYTPGKNLWSIVYIAAKVPNAHFVIAGSTKAASSGKVIGQLESLIDKLRLKNLTLERDVPKERLVNLYEEAKVYLHPLYAEHFGIAIAEGAAAGAVPVVYKDGGGWIDIVSRIDQSLGYTNIDEAAAIVRQLLGNEDLWLRLSRRSVEVAKDFSWDSYKRRLDAAVREAYELKRRSSRS